MTTQDRSLRTLTDARLAQITRARYEALMILEVNGGQYSTAGGRAMVDYARDAWMDARMEQKRREALQRVHLVPVTGSVNEEPTR